MARRLPERPRVAEPDELSRFETHGVRGRIAIRTTSHGDRTYVELGQTARRWGQERQQKFVAAFERLAAIESKAREIARGEAWERRKAKDSGERDRVADLSLFTLHGINVQVAERPGGSPFVRLSQTTKRPDGGERTQRFDITLERLSEIVGRAREVQPKEWFALARLDQRLQTGAIVTIDKVYASRTEAELAAHNSPLFVIPQAFKQRPEEGQRYAMSEGESRKLDRQTREARWREETNGEFHAVGRWFDKGSVPRLNQRVRVDTFAEYRGEHFEHRVTPRGGPLDQGTRAEPVFIVYRKPERPGGPPQVAAICQNEAQATARMRALDEGVRARQVATNQKQWEAVDFSAGLRAHAPAVPVRSVVVGESTAVLFERFDEHGRRQRSVEVTRPERQQDGSVTEVTSTYSLSEFRALAKGLLRPERTQVELRAANPATEERKPAAAPEQPRAQATPPYVDNKHFVLTVWQAKELPNKGTTMARFPLGESEVQNRPSFPAHGRWTPRGVEDPPVYALVKRVLDKQGVGMVEGLVTGEKKLALALKRAEAREAQAVAKEEHLERIAAQRQEHQQQRVRGHSIGF